MDNFYEILILEDPIKAEKERQISVRAEEFTPKQEKQPFQELPNFSSKNPDIHKSPEASKTNERQRLRQYMQSRTDIHVAEGKVMPIKKPCEIKDIERLNISKVPFLPLLSIRTNAIEELYKEIKEMKQNITELEERNKISQQCIETGKARIQDLEDRHTHLRKKAGLGCSYEERKEEAIQKLKGMQQSWKQSTKTLRQRVQELEEEANDLTIKTDSIRNLIFRKAQQQKILKKNLNDSGSNSENGYHSCDLLNSSGQLRTVVHTPSWNSLYGV